MQLVEQVTVAGAVLVSQRADAALAYLASGYVFYLKMARFGASNPIGLGYREFPGNLYMG